MQNSLLRNKMTQPSNSFRGSFCGGSPEAEILLRYSIAKVHACPSDFTESKRSKKKKKKSPWYQCKCEIMNVIYTIIFGARMALLEAIFATKGLECQDTTKSSTLSLIKYICLGFSPSFNPVLGAKEVSLHSTPKLYKFFWGSPFLRTLSLMVNFKSRASFRKLYCLMFLALYCSSCSTTNTSQIL